LEAANEQPSTATEEDTLWENALYYS
jgi:hypothetical protein